MKEENDFLKNILKKIMNIYKYSIKQEMFVKNGSSNYIKCKKLSFKESFFMFPNTSPHTPNCFGETSLVLHRVLSRYQD